MSVRIQHLTVCPTCQGKPFNPYQICRTCKGLGYVRRPDPIRDEVLVVLNDNYDPLALWRQQ